MKLSRYNWLVDCDEFTAAYNGFTGALARVEEDNVEAIKALFKREDEISLEEFDQELIGQLKYGGFVLEENEDELEQLKYMHNVSRYDKEVNIITVVITQECNMGCVYCYQSQTQTEGRISNEVISRLSEYLGTTGKDTQLTLYGGEPLLYPDKCIQTLESCKYSLDSAGKSCKAKLVTNGTLLSCEIAEELSSLGLEQAQVTLDGTQPVHDRQRPMLDGSGSYGRIIENISRASEHIKIRVRINVQESDHRLSCEDIELLKDVLPENVQVYLAPVRYDHIGMDSALFDNTKYLYNNFGFGYRNPPLAAKVGNCIALKISGIVLDWNGEIYKCWHEIGSGSKPVSNIKNDMQNMVEDRMRAQLKWERFRPYETTPCIECRMLPTCGGGCPDDFISLGKPRCTFTTQQYRQFIRYNAIRLYENKLSDK